MSAVEIPAELAQEVAEHPERFRPDVEPGQRVLVLACSAEDPAHVGVIGVAGHGDGEILNVNNDQENCQTSAWTAGLEEEDDLTKWWIERASDPNVIRVSGWLYRIGKPAIAPEGTRHLGFAGRKFTVRRAGGEPVRTNNLGTHGELPESLRALFPDNGTVEAGWSEVGEENSPPAHPQTEPPPLGDDAQADAEARFEAEGDLASWLVTRLATRSGDPEDGYALYLKETAAVRGIDLDDACQAAADEGWLDGIDRPGEEVRRETTTEERRRLAALNPTVWRQGGSRSTEGCTLYEGPRFVGSTRTTADAEFLIQAANAYRIGADGPVEEVRREPQISQDNVEAISASVVGGADLWGILDRPERFAVLEHVVKVLNAAKATGWTPPAGGGSDG